MDTLDKLKVSQLKSELSRRGEDTKGSKVVLVNRLEDVLKREGADPIAFVTKFGESENTGDMASGGDLASEDVDDKGSGGGVAAPDRHVPEEPDGYVPDRDSHCRETSTMLPVGHHGSTVGRDSIAEVGSPAASVSSVSSRRSSCSHASVSSVRAIEQAKMAGLRARVKMMKDKQTLELEKQKLELEMKIRKEELELETEIAEAQARDQVFAEHSKEPAAKICPENVEWRREVNRDVDKREVSRDVRDLERREVNREEAEGGTATKDTARKLMQTEEPQKEEMFASRSEVPRGRPTEGSGQGQVKREEMVYQHRDATQAILTQFQRGQLPKAEIPVFSGDVTKYRSFMRAFDSRISSRTDDDEEKLFYLEQYTSGKPQDIIRGCLHMTAGTGYMQVRRLLDKRYGDEDTVTSAFVDVLMEWPQVKPVDVEGLDRFSLTLTSCNNIMSGISPGARETDHPKTMRKIIEKLPYQLQDKWRHLADKIHEEEHRRAKFGDIVDFVEREVRVQTNPMFGRQHSVSRSREPEGQRSKVQTVSATVVGTDAQQRRVPPKYLFCTKEHFLDQCEELRGKAPHEKSAFIKEKGLCFGCLSRGHLAKECARRRTCSICRFRHPTVLHNDRPPPGPEAPTVSDGHARSIRPQNSSQVVTNGRVKLGNSSKTCADSPSTMMSIVPVKIWSGSGPSIQTYAFLDGGSSATFCSESLLKQLGVAGEDVRLSMTTASVDNQQVDSRVVRGLRISDLDGSTCIAMPPMYTFGTIPVRPEDMASHEDLNQ